MKTFFLLIMLTQNGAGDINASFVNTETLEQCQQKTVLVGAVFEASNIKVIASRCINSPLKFSEFGHASAASMIRTFYLVYLDEEPLRILLMPDWRTCMDQQKMGVKQGRVYCSSSVQSIE